MARVLIAAGGSGGHITPALVFAELMRERGHEAEFIGGERLEAELVPAAGFPLHRIPLRGLARTRAPHRAVATGAVFLWSLAAARRVMSSRSPSLVVGFGGYASLAPSLVTPRGVPLLLHEQNTMLTLAHRVALPRATALAISLPLARRPARRRVPVHDVGNPLRAPIRALAVASDAERLQRRRDARQRFSIPQTARCVLVTGGSQGAEPLNRAIVEVLKPRSGASDLAILHLTGPANLAPARERWSGVDLPVTCEGYVPDMDEALAACDLAVARAGASTAAELTALGIASVLVPYIYGGFQSANARSLEAAGAALVADQREPDFHGRLRLALEALLDDDRRRRSVAAAARALGRPDAARALADLAEELLGEAVASR